MLNQQSDMLPTGKDGPPQGRNGSTLDAGLQELELMLRAQQQRNRQMIDRERDLNMYRSGSAPPTVEGSLTAMGDLFRNSSAYGSGGLNNNTGSSGNNNGSLTDDELRSHPAYLSYYYSNDNINPRLPPPLLSKEDWRAAQRFQVSGNSFGGIGDPLRKSFGNRDASSSLFSVQPSLAEQQAGNELLELRNSARRHLNQQTSADLLVRDANGLVGLPTGGLGARRKSFADIVQDGRDQPDLVSGSLSRPSSRNAVSDMLDMSSIHDNRQTMLTNGFQSMDSLNSPGLSHSHLISRSPSAVALSLSRSTTPEPHLVGRTPGSGLPPVGSKAVEKRHVQNGHMTDPADISAALPGLSLSKHKMADFDSLAQSQLQADMSQTNLPFNMQNGHNLKNLPFSTSYTDLTGNDGRGMTNQNAREINIPKRTMSSASLYYNSSGVDSNISHESPNVSRMDAYEKQKLNLLTRNHNDSVLSANEDRRRMNGQGNQMSPELTQVMDPRYIQYLQKTSDNGAYTLGGLADSSQVGNYFSTLQGNLDRLQKEQLETLLAQQKQQYELLGKYGDLRQLGYYGNPSYGVTLPGNSMNPSLGPGGFQNDPQLASLLRNSAAGGSLASWHANMGSSTEGRISLSLLDELKNNKMKQFELSDIIGHVIEFSTDQYGSRFIQQKLETASVEEKAKIFPEIIPHARTLMTDVFGNYIIQKFFEHGSESQRKELATQLTGYVLPLSLQMYGCRVIQKALEVIGVDQQSEMALELDGSIMKCVRDQNGNHVIQKCIECVPQDRIQFIITSFYGQVVPLSSHPYGCRVIQRVLEHCDDPKTQTIIMDEIMQSVNNLAQDQYGNYVIQHVLEHGKPDERTEIIKKLAGQIVKMSQQKFASNVVEKCLTFGGPEERMILVNEILGTTDENEPLQAMMKDPFGNYVVQKVLETCDDASLELILSRIKVHLNSLKRYTYGKHIVSRVEKLIMTGERRIGIMASSVVQS
ncbi:hypothetical protein ACFE04_010203 [Oxalis oulophora]